VKRDLMKRDLMKRDLMKRDLVGVNKTKLTPPLPKNSDEPNFHQDQA
jgi:hypothetical protein